MNPSKADNSDRLADTWSNKAARARGEEHVAPLNKTAQAGNESPLVDTWANKADQVRANADKFNQVAGMAEGPLAEAFKREQIKNHRKMIAEVVKKVATNHMKKESDENAALESSEKAA